MGLLQCTLLSQNGQASLALWGQDSANVLDEQNVREICGGVSEDSFLASQISLWLPTLNGKLITISDECTDEQPSLSEKSIPALVIKRSALVEALKAVARIRKKSPSLRYLIACLRFAAWLVARGEVEPLVAPCNGSSAWKIRFGPHFNACAQKHALALSRSMPPVVRCQKLDDDVQPSSYSVMTSIVSLMIDAIVDSSKTSSPNSGPPSRVDVIRKGLAAWTRHMQRNQTFAPYRLCLHLHEPDDELTSQVVKDSWTLEFLLQDRTDPTLLVTARDLFDPQKELVHPFEPVTQARDHLLGTLARAAEVVPVLKDSLALPCPLGCDLTVDEVAHLLRVGDELINSYDIAVLSPSSLARSQSKKPLGLRAQLFARGSNLLAGLSIKWEAAIGDSSISIEELNRLATLKSPLVRLAGSWIAIDKEDVKRAIRFIENNDGATPTIGELLKMALEPGATIDDFAVSEITGSEEFSHLVDTIEQLASAPITELKEPAQFVGTLRPYQRQGLSWLAKLAEHKLGACLADDMGLGKTVQTLALILQRIQSNSGKPTLLICPTSVVNNWLREAKAFGPSLRVLVHHGPSRTRSGRFEREVLAYDLVITSYGVLLRDRKRLSRIQWDGVILDEGQNIKNAKSKQAMAARSLQSSFRLVLTGTPVENHLSDLWSIFDFLIPGLLDEHATFRRKLATPIEAFADKEAMVKLKALTAPFILRRKKSDPEIAATLPEKVEKKEYCNLTVEQGTLYEGIVKNLFVQLKQKPKDERAGLILQALTRLKQTCNHPAQVIDVGGPIKGRSGKLARLNELVSQFVEADEPALIFTQYAVMGRMLARFLASQYGIPIPFLHGGLSSNARQKLVDEFQQDSGPPAFIISLKAGGTGLNLTRATQVVHYDRWWNPAVENQATDRAYRIGQTKTVVVRTMICTGTLEDRIDEILERKKALAEGVIGSTAEMLMHMNDSELTSMLQLSIASELEDDLEAVEDNIDDYDDMRKEQC